MRLAASATDISGKNNSSDMSEAEESTRIEYRRGRETRSKADVSVRSRDEIETAIQSLADAQWIRLRKAAEYFAWVYDIEAKDLLQEAFCRALAGDRKCPKHVGVVKFLVEAMRSIANGEGQRVENQVDKDAIDAPDVVDLLKDSTQRADEAMIEVEKEEETRQSVLGLFPDDPHARDIADGILAGYSGQELRELTDLDETAYASKRRYMSRKIGKFISGRQRK
jgi:hypothetical protein